MLHAADGTSPPAARGERAGGPARPGGPGAFADAVRPPGVALAALISANHEVGTVQPVAEAAAVCAAAGVPLLVDAAQSVGRVPVPAGWSVLTASAHKWGGPPGVGLLVVRKGTRWSRRPGRRRGAGRSRRVEPAGGGGGRGLPAGGGRRGDAEAARLSALVERIRATVAATVPDVEVVGDPVERLPHLVTFSCLYVDGEALLHALDRRGFAVSSGSSCTSSTLRPEPRAGGDGRAVARQRAGVAAPGDHRGRGRPLPGRTARRRRRPARRGRGAGPVTAAVHAAVSLGSDGRWTAGASAARCR